MTVTRTLVLLRHVKSSWADPKLDDFDRPLADRGKKAAPLVGREIMRRGLLPDHVLISPSKRTRQTFERVAMEWRAKPELDLEPAIYEAPAEAILDAIRRIPDLVSTLLVVGHNPGLEDLSDMLAAPSSDADALMRLRLKFPTGALACFTVPGDWARLSAGMARLDTFISPKMLTD